MIDTQAIRKKILDLAMRGQLTEQLPEDGTAGELYQQIQSEKLLLINKGTIKKGKPLPEIEDDEIPFEIPISWLWVRVGSVAEIAGGTTPNSSEISDRGTIPYFKVSDMNTHGNETHMIYANNYISASYNGKIFPAGTTIFPKNGGAALTNKRRILTVPSAVDLNTGGCTPIIPAMAGWIRLLMETVDFGRMDTGSNIPTVNATNLKRQVISLPPLAEQQRIVAKIDQAFSVLDTIDELQAQYADNLTALKAKLIDAAIQGKLTEQLPEDGTAEELYQQIQTEKQALIKAGKIKKEKPLPEITADEISIKIPENWKSCRLGSIITLVSGTDYKPEEYNAEMRGTPYITGASNLLPEGVLINRWTETPRCIANDGDVLLVCKGSGYGKVAMCDVEEAHIARQIMAIKKTNLLDMRYILYYLTANFSYLKGKGQGLIPGVDRKSVLGMIFPLPPLAEQKRIAQKIDELMPLFEK